MKKLTLVLIIALAATALGGWYWRRSEGKATALRTTTVQRGDLRVTISATGTIEPEEVVDIGAQVAGQIKSLGVDPRDPSKSIDYTTPVEEGTVLARIDDSLYASDVEQCAAAVDAAKASLQRSQADLQQLNAKVVQSQRDWKRAQDLRRDKGAIAETDYDLALATYETAQSALAVGDASVVQAQKSVRQAEAVLKKSQTNLEYCTIHSPVKGVIIDRRVNVGQTVVSSLNAPSLFLIAKDLKRLQVWVSVNEADIGQIHTGQTVTFTVDAYPKRVFTGEIGKIRLNATMTQNVVTYTVEVNTDNTDGTLLPYQTANVLFEVGKRDKVLLVQNSALRWRPRPEQVVLDARDVVEPGNRKREPGSSGPEIVKDPSERGVLWVREGTLVRPVKVRIGWSDGAQTEVEGEALTEGAEIVVGEMKASNGDSTNNPFAPKMFGSSKSGS